MGNSSFIFRANSINSLCVAQHALADPTALDCPLCLLLVFVLALLLREGEEGASGGEGGLVGWCVSRGVTFEWSIIFCTCTSGANSCRPIGRSWKRIATRSAVLTEDMSQVRVAATVRQQVSRRSLASRPVQGSGPGWSRSNVWRCGWQCGCTCCLPGFRDL